MATYACGTQGNFKRVAVWVAALKYSASSRQEQMAMKVEVPMNPSRVFTGLSKQWRMATIAGALAIAGNMAQAEVTLVYETAGQELFTFDAPDNWVVSTGGNVNPDDTAPDIYRDVPRVIGLLPEGEPGVWVGFFSPDAVSTFSEAEDYVKSLGKGLVEKAEVNFRKTMRIGGREAQVYHGTGMHKGRRVVFTIALIDIPHDRLAIAIMLGENGKRAGYIDAINGMFASFRAVN